MGVSFFWISLRIPPELSSRVATRFAEAMAASPVSPTAHRVLERWREFPDSLRPEWVPDPTRPGCLAESEGTVDFERLFRPEALIKLGQEFFMRGAAREDWGIELSGENSDLILTDRIPAAAAFYFGLGAERAARLPGHFGAFFVTPGDVGRQLALVESVIETPSREMLTQARRWLSRGNTEFDHLEEVFTFVPRALRTAYARREGLLLLTSRG